MQWREHFEDLLNSIVTPVMEAGSGEEGDLSPITRGNVTDGPWGG